MLLLVMQMFLLAIGHYFIFFINLMKIILSSDLHLKHM